MPAAIPIAALVVSAAAATYGGIEANQQTQHAKGAAQAEQTAMNNQIATAQAGDANTQKAKAEQGSSTQAAALAALKASMSSSTSSGGTILSGPQGAAAAPTQTKTLLGV